MSKIDREIFMTRVQQAAKHSPLRAAQLLREIGMPFRAAMATAEALHLTAA